MASRSKDFSSYGLEIVIQPPCLDRKIKNQLK